VNRQKFCTKPGDLGACPAYRDADIVQLEIKKTFLPL
jgi:hypothetical protein